jgi:hypothetical protein
MRRAAILAPFTTFALAILLIIASAPYAKHYAETRKCGKHLAVISQAARVWANAHNGRLPSGFIVLSNELATPPRLLVYPGDKSREPADNWQAFTDANSSYQIWKGASDAKEVPFEFLQNMGYLRCEVHAGNYANALGKVSVHSPPLPLTIRFLAVQAIVAFLGRRLWQRYCRQLSEGQTADWSNAHGRRASWDWKSGQRKYTTCRGLGRSESPTYSAFCSVFGVTCLRLHPLASSVGFGTTVRVAPVPVSVLTNYTKLRNGET